MEYNSVLQTFKIHFEIYLARLLLTRLKKLSVKIIIFSVKKTNSAQVYHSGFANLPICSASRLDSDALYSAVYSLLFTECNFSS